MSNQQMYRRMSSIAEVPPFRSGGRTQTAIGETRVQAEFISIREAAETLAVSEDTIRRMVWRGDLKGYRVGRLIRLRIDELVGMIGG